MKRFILYVMLMIISAAAFSQTQVAEHEYSKAEYLGHQNGHHKINVTNKQACAVNHFLEWNDRDTMILVPAASELMVELPDTYTGGEIIRVKPDSRCNSSFGTEWLSISTPVSTPVKFKSFTVRKVKKS